MERVALPFEDGYRPGPHRRARLQIRTPTVFQVIIAAAAAAGVRVRIRLAASSSCPCLGDDSMQRIQILLHVVFLVQFIRARLFHVDDDDASE